MPAWLHRTTKQHLLSIASADLPEPEINYIEEPDISVVQGQPVRYWIINGDSVSLADASTQISIDAAIAAAELQDEKDEAKIDSDRRLLGFMEVMVDEINVLRQAAGIPPARTLDEYKAATHTKIDGQSS